MSTKTERYREYRAADQELMRKVGQTVKRSAMNRAAQMLGIDQSTVIRNEPETGISILIDFTLHDIRSDGKSAVQRYRESPGPADDLEDKLLMAHVLSTTSLYKVIEISRSDDSVVLRDLLRTADDVHLSDIYLSQSARVGLLLFARCLILDDLSMNSGMALGFPAQLESALLRSYQQRAQQIDLVHDERRRFVYFFQEYEARGMTIRYQQPLQQ